MCKNVKKQNKQRLYTAGVWLSEAKKRVGGVDSSKPKKSQDALPSAPADEKVYQLGGGEGNKLYPS
jgi:hypothetical protein